MADDLITSSWIFTRFILPFLLVLFVVYAILRKTKLLGDNNQIDALVSFVVAFIFISVLQPTEIVSNLILFLTVAIIVMFVGLLLWGFVSGQEMKASIFGESNKGLKWVAGVVIIVAVIIALIWAAGVDNTLIYFFFKQGWSKTFWTNVIFIVVVAIALAIVLKSGKN